MNTFLEFKLKTGKKISVNLKHIKEVFESINGNAIILISRKENFEVEQNYEEVLKRIIQHSNYATIDRL